MAVTPWPSERERRRRTRIDILGPRDHLDLHRFRRLRRAVERIRYPWDGFFMIGIFAFLYLTAVLGTEIVVATHGSPVGLATGIPLVAVSSSIAAHLGRL